MFSAVLCGYERNESRAIEQLAVESRHVCIYKFMSKLPSTYELTVLLNTFSPDIFFLELKQWESALLLSRQVRVIRQETAIIGFGAKLEEGKAREAADAGIVEVLPPEPSREQFQRSVSQAMERCRIVMPDNLVAFLPAKAGSGSTTVAMNVAGCLARNLEQKVLFVEADVRSGLVSVLLKLPAEHTILDALDNAGWLDGTLWDRIVVKAHDLDLLVTLRPKSATVVPWSNYHQLLQFVQPRYHTVVVDLPELVNDATVEIVRRARRTFVVCTTELPSLVLARHRCAELKSKGIPADRISIILNRWNQQELTVNDMEQFFDVPISAHFQNDYHCVRRAIVEGRLVGLKSGLGKSFVAFARQLASAPPLPPPQNGGLAFLQSIIPGRLHT